MCIDASFSEIRKWYCFFGNVGKRRVSALLISVLWILDPRVLVAWEVVD